MAIQYASAMGLHVAAVDARWHYALRVDRRNQARPPGGIGLRRRRAALHAPESLLRKCRSGRDRFVSSFCAGTTGSRGRDLIFLSVRGETDVNGFQTLRTSGTGRIWGSMQTKLTPALIRRFANLLPVPRSKPPILRRQLSGVGRLMAIE
jgi:hypothetical protein